MLEKSTISPSAAVKPSMDFLRLREEALDVVRQLSGDAEQGWTDHNLHDPGITILEQLCYALTDLGYRLNFSVPELLADALQAGQGPLGWKPDLDPSLRPTLPGMPGMEEVLPAAPTTLNDWRKVLLDIVGMRSVGMIKAADPSPKLYFDSQYNEMLSRQQSSSLLRQIDLHGLYEIHADADEGLYESTRHAIEEKFQAWRPAGEDMHLLAQLQPGPIVIEADIDIASTTSIEEVLADMFLSIDQYISPQAKFHDPVALAARGMRIEDILEGPHLKGGVLMEEDIVNNSPKSVLYLSKVIECIYAVQGVNEVRSLRLRGKMAQMTVSEGVNYWVPLVTKGVVPRLDPDIALLKVRVEGLLVPVNGALVQSLFVAKREVLIARGRTTQQAPQKQPRNRDIASYQSVQHQFPDNYGINGKGLPVDATPRREAQAHQLKTWLLFFEQALSSYFAKAGHLGRLFQMSEDKDSHYPVGSLQDVPEVAASFLPLQQQVAELGDEAAIKALRRLERLLSHLLARFGHEAKYFPQSVRPNTPLRQSLGEHVAKLIAFYRDLPEITKDRGQGSPLLRQLDGRLQPGGLKARVARLLGLRPAEPDLNLYPDKADAVQQMDFFMIEHALLRPMAQDYAKDNMLFRFRNGKISKIYRLRNTLHPTEVYRFRCYSTGTSAIKAGDSVEIVFSFNNHKEVFVVDEVTEDSFTIPVSIHLATHGNPQGGSWNKISREASILLADPWSLQISYVFPGYDARFRDPHHRALVDQLLRQETPSHLTLHLTWLTAKDMLDLCEYYYLWRVAYDAYLQDRIYTPTLEKSYIVLRHYRNVVMRYVVAGETEPFLDLTFTGQAAAKLTWSTEGDGTLVATMAQADKQDLYFELPEVEPEITYAIGSPSTVEGEVVWTALTTLSTPLGADGRVLKLEKAQLSKGTNTWAILAHDQGQGLTLPLYQKIKVVVT